MPRPTASPGWTLAIVSIALFMTALDNLVVGVALPSIRADLNGSIETLEWTVNSYTLAPSIEALIAARAVQGFGAAIVTPLTLTLLSEAVPAQKRGLALGVWAGVTGLVVAMGPLVGGAVVEGISWHWIFWLNVPIGLVLAPLAVWRLDESYGPRA